MDPPFLGVVETRFVVGALTVTPALTDFSKSSILTWGGAISRAGAGAGAGAERWIAGAWGFGILIAVLIDVGGGRTFVC